MGLKVMLCFKPGCFYHLFTGLKTASHFFFHIAYSCSDLQRRFILEFANTGRAGHTVELESGTETGVDCLASTRLEGAGTGPQFREKQEVDV